jgi:L-malate glycosyltransferase
MRIGFIEPGLHVCGGIRRIIETSNRLVKLGHEVTIFTPKGNGCHWLPSKTAKDKLSELPAYNLDVVIFNLAEQYKHAQVAKAQAKVFWVLAPEALYKIPEIPVRALHQDFYLMANSKFTVQYILNHIKKDKPKYKIPIIPGGINPKHFRYDAKIPKNYHAMYYGSARPWKGTGIIETALRSSPYSKFLKMEGLNTPQDQLYKLYNTASVYVSAGQIEGFNFPILEAMACGCPVICTDDGGSRDFVKNEENALVVRRNHIDIKNALVKLLENKTLQARLRSAGLTTAANPKYNWENVTKKLEKVLENLL